jgi:hypothetical protein
MAPGPARGRARGSESRCKGGKRHQSEAWLQASNPAPAGGAWLGAQRGKPHWGGPIPSWPRRPPSSKSRWLPRPIAQPIGAQSSGLQVSAWSGHTPGKRQAGSNGPDQRRRQLGTARNRTHWPGQFHRGRPRGGPSGRNGTGAHGAARPGPILAIPRDTLGDGSPSSKPASTRQAGPSQGLAATPANQSVPVQ